MAAFETPWVNSMSRSTSYTPSDGSSTTQTTFDPHPPTVAAFSPTTTSGYSASSKQRSTIIVHKKSPLLVATPPQITRALAHSHPFLLPLNKVAGLLTWTTKDAWESYLLVTAFWAISLYGDEILRFASPIVVVAVLILAMYSRRYSPLSSTTKTGDKHIGKGHERETSDSLNHKSLDEIVETLQEFTTRCKIILEPFLSLTDFLSIQRTPTSATTRPALTTLFIRILFITPIWIVLTLPPFYIITTRRLILTVGTVVLTWHSRPLRVSRVILWRSVFLRRLATFVTGLEFDTNPSNTDTIVPPALPPRKKSQLNLASAFATKRRPDSSGVRFTFILYENQRRWIGLGWTTSLFAYERGPWTDEHLNPAASRGEFELPDVEGGHARWRWVEGSEWQIEHGDPKHRRTTSQTKKDVIKPSKPGEDGGGWIYYDTKWENGRPDDGWGRYTRRRKWVRDAELVEVTPSTEASPARTPVNPQSEDEDERLSRARAYAQSLSPAEKTPSKVLEAPKEEDVGTPKVKKKTGWFVKRERSDSKSSSGKNTSQLSTLSGSSRDGPEDDHHDKWRDSHSGQRGFSVVEDVAMSLG